MRRFFLCNAFAAFFAALGAPIVAAPPVHAQANCVAAMVNDLPITGFELSQRVRFALMLTRVADSADNRSRVSLQVLRQMVDERLQLDDAKRNGISVSQGEVDERVRQLEQANNMPAGGIKAMLGNAGIPFTVLTDQMRASIAWNKVVRRKVRAGIDVTDPEIDAAMGQMRANTGKSENRVAEIFLPVDKPDQAADAQRTAQRIVAQLRAGTPFPALVQQFSSGPSAATGGDLGWILPGTLDPALDSAIARLSVNQVSEPVRTQAGWHVLKLLAQRSVGTAANPAAVRLNMAQILLPFPANSSPDEIERQKGVAQGIMSKARSCADLRRACDRTKGCTADSTDGVSLGELAQRAPAIAEAARAAPVGQPLGPYQAGNAMQIVAVCSREGDGGLPSRDAIQQNIYVGKLEAAAKRYMRDLRRNAIIDMRKDCRI